MFTIQNVLRLRTCPQPSSLIFELLDFRRRYRRAGSVMEAKQYLLQCARRIKPELFPLPAWIVVEAGAKAADIKSELERWLRNHPRLRRVKVVCSPASWWLKWIAKRTP